MLSLSIFIPIIFYLAISLFVIISTILLFPLHFPFLEKPKALNLNDLDDKSKENLSQNVYIVNGTTKLLTFLGSGGHTMEMLAMIKTLDPKLNHPRVYLISDTDRLSQSKLIDLEKSFKGINGVDFKIYSIPRSREVGQSWLSTPFSVFKTLFESSKILTLEKPNLVLANGPGSCVPIFLLARIFRVLNFSAKPLYKLVYIESLARVKELSLSGRLLYPIADLFLVQWEDLIKKYPSAKFQGILV